MTLKKRIIVVTTAIMVVFGVYVVYFIQQLEKALNPDPDFNTVFTEKYAETNFKKLKIGDSLESVYHLLGKPFKIDTLLYNEQMLYTNSPKDVFFD